MNPTGGPDDVERRLSAVEEAVAQLRGEVVEARTDASAARVLAAGADHDVSEVRAELRAHTQALNALRETQVEQGRELTEHGRVLNEHSRVLNEHSRVLNEQSRQLALVAVGIQHITDRLDYLIERDS